MTELDDKVDRVVTEYLRTHLGLTNNIQSILRLLYGEGVGDQFINAKAKRIGKRCRESLRLTLIIKIRQELEDLYEEEVLQDVLASRVGVSTLGGANG